MMDSHSEIGGMIFEAAGSGNLAKLVEIEEKLGDKKEFLRICMVKRDYTGRTVLHLAAEKGYYLTCKFFIENVKLNANIRTYGEDTPLILAAKEGRIKIVRYLLNKGSNIVMSNSEGYTSLHYAVQNGNLNLMRVLLGKGALLEVDSVDGTPLQCAASRGDVKALKLLLGRHANIDSITTKFGSPLISAIESQSYECVNLLLEKGADINKKVYGLNAWAHAAKGNTKFLRCLIDEAEEPPNLKCKGLMSPIEHAALALNREGVEILFPLTERIQYFPVWTVDGIMDYYSSSGFKKKKSWRSRFHAVTDKAWTKMVYEKYSSAARYFTEAILADPTNPEWLSDRSHCLRELGFRVRALRDEHVSCSTQGIATNYLTFKYSIDYSFDRRFGR